MKRCPKCSRTYPDDNQKFCTVDGGLLLSTEQAFDPNATIQISTPQMGSAPSPEPRAGWGEAANLGETVALSAPHPTADIPRQTGPTPPLGTPEPASVRPTTALPPTAALPPRPQVAPSGAPVAPPAPKSKLPLILGILLVLLVLGVGAVVALFFLVIKPRLNQMQTEPRVVTRRSENLNVNQNANTSSSNTNTAEQPAEPEFVPPLDAVKFTNSETNLDGKLAEHYVDFSFYYPKTWEVDPKAGVPGASNFAKVERRLPPDFTQENFAVGWYTSKGTFEADEPTFPQLVKLLGASLANGFPEYQKVSEGPTKINSLDGYEFRFASVSRGTEKGDIQLWGRVVFLPSGVSGNQTGATLIMLATSLAPELAGVNDVGTKGEIPVILDSFRFGKGR